MLQIRRDLLWDYEVPSDPERDPGFVALYVGRVLDRGTAEDVRALGLERIRRHLEVAPARRDVIEFWRWYLDCERSRHVDPDRSAAPVPADGRVGPDRPR